MKKLGAFLRAHGGKILFLVVVVLLAYFSYQYYYIRTTVGGGAAISQTKQVKRAEENIRKLFDLPSDKPQAAFIKNAATLKQSQPFFNASQDGDLVLVYSDRIIVYRPSTQKIVAMGPAPAQNNGAQAASASSQTQQKQTVSPKIEVRNGTTISGLAKKVAQKISDAVAGSDVSATTSAAKTDYTETTVYAKTETGKAAAAQVAQSIKAKLTTEVPSGEGDTKSDILVIAGSDQK
jgi:hypothetical protein